LKAIWLNILIVTFLSLFGVSCTPIRQVAAFYKSTDSFHPIGENVSVEEIEDAAFGLQIQAIIPQYSDSIQRKLGYRFTKPVNVYVCHTTQSFCKYTGSKYPGPRAKVFRKVLISPRLEGTSEWKSIVYHELVHLLLMQHLGIYDYQKIPVWFHEGLATMIANGGGSGDVTDSLAMSGIKAGKHFDPVDRENFLFPRSFEGKDVGIWTQYRQAMLFVAFMQSKDSLAFKMLEEELIFGKLFRIAVQDAYHENVAGLWKDFTDDIEEHGAR
jgi:hypothetical protein